MTINEIEAWVGSRLPAAYRAFLCDQFEDRVYGDVNLYGRADFVEMNECHDVKRFCPGHVTIGDEGGGRQFLLALADGRMFLVGADDLDPTDAVPGVPEEFASWLTAGCPLPAE
jgi:hypothetical protein